MSGIIASFAGSEKRGTIAPVAGLRLKRCAKPTTTKTITKTI